MVNTADTGWQTLGVRVPGRAMMTRFQAACSEANAPGHVLLARLLDLYDESRGLRRSTVQHPLGYMRPVAAKRKPRRKPKPKAAQ